MRDKQREAAVLTRRDFMRGTAAIAGTALAPSAVGCGTSGDPERRGRFDSGDVPIELSGWFGASHLTRHAPLTHDVDADVAVVGAGLAGTSLALYLAEAGVSVALLEAHQPGWGASGRNAGHAGPKYGLGELAYLPDGGAAINEYFFQHHDTPFEIIERHGIACDAQQNGLVQALQWNAVAEDATTAAKELQARGRPVRFVAEDEMHELTGSRRYRSGVFWEDGGRFNPLGFTAGTASAAVRSGARVFGDSPAVGIERDGARWRMRTNRGAVRADRVVFCTGGYTRGVVREFDACYSPVTAYGLTTKPLPDDLRRALLPQASTLQQEPVNMHSFLVDGAGRIVTSLLPRITGPEAADPHFQDLLVWLRETWPQSREHDIELEGYWTGAMAFTSDGCPRIFQAAEGLLALMGFSGSGNVRAPVLGRHLAEALAQDDLAQLALPLDEPKPVRFPSAQSEFLRRGLVPLGRLAEAVGII